MNCYTMTEMNHSYIVRLVDILECSQDYATTFFRQTFVTVSDTGMSACTYFSSTKYRKVPQS